MGLALDGSNAWEEVFSLFKKQTPKLANANYTDYNPALIKQDPNNPSRVLLVITSKNPAVVKGSIVVSYERADLVKLFNKFADDSKIPIISLSLNPGTSYKLSEFIDVLNATLGTALTVKGSSGYYDIVDATFTAPAKGGTINVSVATDAIPSDGAFAAMPLRVSNASTGQVKIANRGVTVDKLATVRSINPFVRADGNLNAGTEPISVANPTASVLLRLYNMDFSELFGTVALFNSRFRKVPGNSRNGVAQLMPETIKLINEKFALEGVPLIDENRPTTSVDIVPSDTYVPWAIETMTLTTYYDQYRKTYMGLTAAPFLGMNGYGTPNAGDRGGVAPAHINKAFKYYVRLAPLGGNVDHYNKMPYDNNKAHDLLPINQRPLYLFFNDLM